MSKRKRFAVNFLADLHIHSPYSRATSKGSNLSGLAAWAQIKGINLIGTGDFTHPDWFAQLEEQLMPAEQGLFRRKDPLVPQVLQGTTPTSVDIRFILTAEISSIYKRHDKVRKVHNIIFCPDLESARAFNARLAAIGNIHSDGRPILGLDSRDLLEIVLEEIPGGFLVPAHIWTPWFSLFGSKSGFDTVEECFGDLSDHIFALETGLSSDPDMNRLISALDRFTLISNSDCHSPSKLGRELNLFDCELSFGAMREALEHPSQGFRGTVEFYPEEGKYHHDGHRKCGICFDPATTREHNNICPVCGKPLTIGVSHRVMELADRNTPYYPDQAPGFESLIPLPEILSEILGVGFGSKAVLQQYARLIGKFGAEFTLLRDTPVEDISSDSTLLGEAIKRVRERKVIRQAGFDGQFGIIHVFENGEIDTLAGVGSLFANEKVARKAQKALNKVGPKLCSTEPAKKKAAPEHKGPKLNAEQQEIIHSTSPHILVSAGPGTGKTFTLVERMVRLLATNQRPENLFAITFTNKAADEIKERLSARTAAAAATVFSGTFHTFCLHWLRKAQPALAVIGDETRQLLIKQLFANLNPQERNQIRAEVISYFHFRSTQPHGLQASVSVQSYLSHLEKLVAVDLDAIIPTFLACLHDADFKKMVTGEVRCLFVDEFQDVNQAQYDLVSALADTAEVFAIGDQDQAIYGFRGSDLKFFFQFGKDHNATLLKLTANYRCRPEIVKAAAALIAHNTVRSAIVLSSKIKKAASLHKLTLENAQKEGQAIARTIEKLVGGTSSLTVDQEGADSYTFKDIAVLFRMGRQAAILAAELANLGIPFQQSGAAPFFMKAEVRPLYHFLLAATGKATIADTLQLLGAIKGIGHTTLDLLEQKIPAISNDIWQELTHVEIPHVAMEKIAALHEIMALYKEGAQKDGSRGLGKVAHFLGLDLDHDLIKKFINFSRALGGMDAAAHHFLRHAEATVYDDRAEAVALMTMHSAKGLEFPVVFIAGLEEGLCPYISVGSNLEEERRLLYVAMTRAKEKLFVTRSTTRHGAECTPSRFLNELPSQLFTAQDPPVAKKKKKTAVQLKLF
ncbi:MAG: UvrD-helicase domain-containing protein [Proteobacteria bacterium]|nr:UvrD-helicase domain-containing protein [Pseudomonadota bacterium]MBU1640988.1 UvrD-helicase domain-containing protein [Pseudomonadota bacterium]